MLGSNREYLERQLPQIKEILRLRLPDVLKGCGLVIVTQKRAEFSSAVNALDNGAAVIDLTGAREQHPVGGPEASAIG
jgi:GDP-mannose 6-dehydrogenase